MPAATFWTVHTPSKSRAIVEFTLQDRKVKLSGVYFTQGNVVDINVVRILKRQAQSILIHGPNPFLPFVG
jgi:predicted metallo-beta-lactamase superfamily hydrolase